MITYQYMLWTCYLHDPWCFNISRLNSFCYLVNAKTKQIKFTFILVQKYFSLFLVALMKGFAEAAIEIICVLKASFEKFRGHEKTSEPFEMKFQHPLAMAFVWSVNNPDRRPRNTQPSSTFFHFFDWIKSAKFLHSEKLTAIKFSLWPVQ